jgi:hypothetical protein
VPIRKAADFLGISTKTLRRWDREGTFAPSFVSPGGHRYYAIADLEKMTKGLFRIAHEWASAEHAHPLEEEFYCATSDRFKTRLECMAHQLDANLSLQEVASFVSSAAGEIGNNSFDHNLGNWPDVMGVCFAYDVGKRVMVLADRGVGILATLRRVKPDLLTHHHALRVAFTEFVTGRAPEHRGNGLKYVLRALQHAKADFFFQSGDAALEIKKGQKDFMLHHADIPIRGCLARIQF